MIDVNPKTDREMWLQAIKEYEQQVRILTTRKNHHREEAMLADKVIENFEKKIKHAKVLMGEK